MGMPRGEWECRVAKANAECRMRMPSAECECRVPNANAECRMRMRSAERECRVPNANDAECRTRMMPSAERECRVRVGECRVRVGECRVRVKNGNPQSTFPIDIRYSNRHSAFPFVIPIRHSHSTFPFDIRTISIGNRHSKNRHSAFGSRQSIRAWPPLHPAVLPRRPTRPETRRSADEARPG
jgi:hypothetical protein